MGRYPVYNILIVVLLVAVTVSIGYGRDYVARKKVGGYTIEITINRNPPIVAKNELRIDIKDSQGKPLKGLTVMVNYYMPPMPGMAPMNYTVQASPKGDGYTMTMNLIMTGPWNIVIKTIVEGKNLSVIFPIDVR
jgi:hypothetical protein